MTSYSETLHGHLIGVPGSRDQLNTPALVLDQDAFLRNVAAMADFARDAGLVLRPHAKTHKSAQVARAQIAAGAVGQCCAKLGEAEALAAEGIEGILLTSPVVPAPAIARLVKLNDRMTDFAVVVDHPDNVDALAAAARDRPIRVLIDIDPRINRTGVASPEAALALAQRIANYPALVYGGVQFYCGRQQHIPAYPDRRAAIAELNGYLASVVDLLSNNGFAPPVITGGGTGTHRIDAELGMLTELQVGSYIFMDRDYGDCDLGTTFETSLTVDARVISANHPGMVTIDAGHKALSIESRPPRVLSGAPTDATYRVMGDEHGALNVDLPLGARVTLSTPHVDPTVNQYDVYHVVQGDTLVAIWPIEARGRSA